VDDPTAFDADGAAGRVDPARQGGLAATLKTE
jgi:hypothetical protein